MHGVKRVIIFFLTIMVAPTILIILPLYLRHHVFADVAYVVSESDILEVVDGISSVFCESQTLRMNATFNAFQLDNMPTISITKRKHIRLKKSMTLPDDTFEYWGFHLLKGATVKLKLCSRYEGSRILVVRGEKNLHTCHLLDRHVEKFGATLDREHKQVKVTFETKQEIPYVDQTHTTNRINGEAKNTQTDDVQQFLQKKLGKYKHLNGTLNFKRQSGNSTQLSDSVVNKTNTSLDGHTKRHTLKEFKQIQQELYKLQQELNSDEQIDLQITRPKRNINHHILDAKIQHGGNAFNYSEKAESSASSFEAELLICYDGHILLTESFPPNHLCTDVHYLETGEHMETVHNVMSNGYYHYIFYSDNDYISNDIHLIFDIYKPTFQYANVSNEKKCINQKECSFNIPFDGYQTVIVEVPTRDGIEQGDDVFLLVSTCHPRMSVYMIFPILIMVLVLGCAYL